MFKYNIKYNMVGRPTISYNGIQKFTNERII